MANWHFRIFNLSVVHLGNRYIPRPVRVFKEFAVRAASTYVASGIVFTAKGAARARNIEGDVR
jgi:hypothetical protein